MPRRTREPAAEREPARDLVPLEWMTAKAPAPARERRVRVENPQTAADHERERIRPVGGSDDQVMPQFGFGS